MKPSLIGILLGLLLLVVGISMFYVSGVYFLERNIEFMLAFGVGVFVNILGTLIIGVHE